MDDILSIQDTPPDHLQEVLPKSSLPWVWFGFLFAAAFIIEETLMVVLDIDESIGNLILMLIGISGWIFWLFCVSRFHTILSEISRKRYPISNSEAVARHFIPFYNLFWVFRWPATMSDYLNRRGRVQMVSGNLLGLFLLVSLLARFFDGGVGLAGMFVVSMYISAKLNRHLQLIQGGALPPIPDPSMFRQTPAAENRSDG